MEGLFLKLLYWIITNCLYIVDSIMEVFGVLTGLNQVQVDGGEDEYLLDYMITNANLQRIFMTIAAIGLAVALMFTMMSLAKNVVVRKKGTGKIAFQFFTTAISTMLTAFITIAVIYIANEILILIDYSFKSDATSQTTLGQKIINICAGNQLPWTGKDVREFAFSAKEGISMFGHIDGGAFTGFPDLDTAGYDGLVYIRDFQFLVGVLVSIGLIIVMIQTTLGLTTRLFNIVFLYLSAPLCIATVPLDDGARFKMWRETIISKILLAYGSVLAVNVYILILPKIMNISIGSSGGLVNTLFTCALVLCGAMTIPGGQLLFSRLVGTSAEEGRETTHGLRSMAGTLIAGGHIVASAGRAVFGGTNKYGQKSRGLLRTGARAAGTVANATGSLLGGNAYRGAVAKVKTGASNLKSRLKGNFGKVNASDPLSSGKMMKRGGLIGTMGAAGRKAKELKEFMSNGMDL